MRPFGFLITGLLVLMALPARAEKPEDARPTSGAQVVYDVRPALNEARRAMQTGDFAKAEQLYALILKVLPDLHEVRMEYAAAAKRAGAGARSRALLVPLDVDALPPGQRSAYRAIAWGEKPFSLSVSPRFGYDSNVNGGSGRDSINIRGTTFSLNEESQAQGGMGTGMSVAGQALWMQNSRVAWGSSAVVDTDYYSDSAFNEVRGNLSAGPRVLTGPVLLRANALTGRSYLGGDQLEHYVGGQLAGSFDAAPGLPMSLSAAQRHYTGAQKVSSNRDRVADSYAATLSSRDVLPWKGGIYVGFGYDTQDWERDTEDNASYRMSAGMELPVNGWADPTLSLSVTRRLYENPVPLLGTTRAEWRVEPSVRVALPKLKSRLGVPYVQYGYARNISNIELTDYDQHRVTGGFVLTAW